MKTKKFITALSLLGILILAGVFYAFTPKDNAKYTLIKHPDWKNLKVLPQDISKDSLIGLMKGYEKSLGVECNFCHAPKKDNPKRLDFPSDAKIQKKIARGMIEMTNAINADYFKPHYPDPKPAQVSDVQCIMCHRGNKNPEEYLGNVSEFYHQKSKESKKH